MSCHFRLKSSYFFFLQGSKYFISCIMIATFRMKGIIRLYTKFSKMLSVISRCSFPRMNTFIFPESEPASALFVGSFRVSYRKTCKQWEEIPTVPCYASLPNQYSSRIISLKRNLTANQQTVSHFLPYC